MKFKMKKTIGMLIPLVATSVLIIANKNESIISSNALATNSYNQQIYAVGGKLTYMKATSASSSAATFKRKKIRTVSYNGTHADAYCLDKDKGAVNDGTATNAAGSWFIKRSGTDQNKKLLYAMEYNTGLTEGSDKDYYVRAMGAHYVTGDYTKMTKRPSGTNPTIYGDKDVTLSTWQLRDNLDANKYPTSQDVSISLSPGSITFNQNGSNYESNWININVNNPSTTAKVGISEKFLPILKKSVVTVTGAPIGAEVIKNDGTPATGKLAEGVNIGTDKRFWVRIPSSSVTGSVSISVTVSSTFEVGSADIYNPEETSRQPMGVRGRMDKTVKSSTINSNTITGGGKVVVTKRDDEGNLLSGVKFQLQSSSTTTNELTTGTEGVVTFDKVPAGTYTLVETYTPWGYVNPGNKTVTVTSGKTTNVEIVNPKAYGNFKVIKKDESGRPLAGAKFQLQLGSRIAAGPFTTGADGSVTFTNMPIGGYSLVEVSAPTGYLIDDATNWQIIEVPHNQTGQIEVVNKTIRGNIQVTKLDSLDHKKLSGAVFTLYDSSGRAVDEAMTDASGFGIFRNVPYGNYTVRETKAPYVIL